MVQSISRTPEIQKLTEIKPAQPRKVVSQKDTLAISSEAKAALQRKKEIQLAWEAINAAPDIREDKVSLVRERLNNGLYNQPNIIEACAEKIMESMGL
ncbi:TPA: hypothetical protein DCX15_05255 [bacterium]|nr:hypothetical protein [bacterium]